MPITSNHKKAVLFSVLGGSMGYAYYHFVGCQSGSCAITSSPVLSSVWGAAMGFFSFQSFFNSSSKTKKMNIQEFVEKGAKIVDVRSPDEFSMGHIAGSINIPLQELVQRFSEVENMKAPIIFCCASGNRSGQATQYAQSQNIDCINGGGWSSLNRWV
jgi:rhodanese-related sulfurtransferase